MARIARRSALLLGLVLAGCGVRLVSPYQEEVARRASRLHDDVIAFELQMRRQAGTPAGDPRAEANQRRLDEWEASVATMTALSEAADPRVIRCADLVPQLGGTTAGEVREGATDAAVGEDCQTIGLTRLSRRVQQLRRLYDDACRVPGEAGRSSAGAVGRESARARLPDCEALWTPPPTSAALGLTGSHGLAVDAVLRSIRAVMAVQERKRAGAG